MKELWNYRELFVMLALRDVKIRYSQTALGLLWAILQPVMTMVIFSFFLGHLAKMPSQGIPYPLFSLSALVPWTFMSNGVQQGSLSLVGKSEMVRKVYLPRFIIPSSAVLSSLPDLAVSLLLLLGMMVYYLFPITWRVVCIPFLVIFAIFVSLGFALWGSAAAARFRDVRPLIPFAVQTLLFISPIAYPSNLLTGGWRIVYGINPVAGVVEAFRWSLLGVEDVSTGLIAVSITSAAAIFVGGLWFFRSIERSFADVM